MGLGKGLLSASLTNTFTRAGGIAASQCGGLWVSASYLGFLGALGSQNQVGPLAMDDLDPNGPAHVQSFGAGQNSLIAHYVQ